MDDYDAFVAKQSRGAFSKGAERQIIRASAEHWSQRQRYSSERNSRLKRYAAWITTVGGAGLIILKAIEFFATGKGV